MLRHRFAILTLVSSAFVVTCGGRSHVTRTDQQPSPDGGGGSSQIDAAMAGEAGCSDGACSDAAPCIEGEACDDGDACTTGDMCVAGVCSATGTLECDDANPCTEDVCEAAVGCVSTAMSCDDGLDCTDDGCFVELGCAHRLKEGQYLVGERCSAEGPTELGPCRELEEQIIVDLPDGTPCDDVDQCTIETLCEAGKCTSGRLLDCSDDDPLSTDTCTALSGCIHDKTCDQFQLNLGTAGAQQYLGVHRFSAGGGVVAWANTQDISKFGISFRLFGADGSAGEETDVLAFGDFPQIYGKWTRFSGFAGAGPNRFVVGWDQGLSGQGLFRIYERDGSPATDQLELPAPILPEPLQPGEMLIASAVYASLPDGFLVLRSASTEPSGPNYAQYFYHYGSDGEILAGPVTMDLDPATTGGEFRVLARDPGRYQLFYGSGSGFAVQDYDLATLTPLGPATTVEGVANGYPSLLGVEATPSGFVAAVTHAYEGIWLYWLDEQGERQAASTLETVAGHEAAALGVGLATWTDGRTLVASATSQGTNGMTLSQFVGPDVPVAAIRSFDCGGRTYRTEPRVVRLGDDVALVAWTSSVTDGDSGSVQGRLVRWPAP